VTYGRSAALRNRPAESFPRGQALLPQAGRAVLGASFSAQPRAGYLRRNRYLRPFPPKMFAGTSASESRAATYEGELSPRPIRMVILFALSVHFPELPLLESPSGRASFIAAWITGIARAAPCPLQLIPRFRNGSRPSSWRATRWPGSLGQVRREHVINNMWAKPARK